MKSSIFPCFLTRRQWVKLWVNFPKIYFKFWKARNKLNFLYDRWLHQLVSILPLTVVPPSSAPRFLALVKNTIRCKNFFNKKSFTTLSGAHHEKWKFMSKHKFWICFGFQGSIVRQFGPLDYRMRRFFRFFDMAAIIRFRCPLVYFSVCNAWGESRETPYVIAKLFLDPGNTAAFSHCFLSSLLNRSTWRRWSFKESNSGLPHSGQFLLNLYDIFTTQEPPTYWRK